MTKSPYHAERKREPPEAQVALLATTRVGPGGDGLEVLAGAVGEAGISDARLTAALAVTAFRFTATKRGASQEAAQFYGVMLPRLRVAPWAAVIALGLLVGCATRMDHVRINQVQVIGTHNSYHLRAHDSLLMLVAQRAPELARGLDYSHRPLPEQLSRLGIRQIELDCFADPKGGLYADPRGPKLAAALGLPPVPNHDPAHRLRAPGFKVMHVQDMDYFSSVLTLVEGLQQVRAWSEQHPRHFPIFILLELKEDQPDPALSRPVPFGERELGALEAEILSVFPRQKILTPDEVRGQAATLPEALRQHGWPRLKAARGKVIFGLDNESAVRELYLKGHPALAGRLIFVSVPPTHPAAAWMKDNDPIGDFGRIQELVRAGFLVRTRADAETIEARANDPRRRDQALASGAQFISTDYPEANPAFSPYAVGFEDGIVVRINPVNGDSSLRGVDLEKGTPDGNHR